MYKSFLQTFCQRKKWPLPVYSATKGGPDHLPHFLATVTVNGTSFASEVAAKSAKEAHNEAARVAFVQLGSTDGVLNSSHGAVSDEGLQTINGNPQPSGSAEIPKDMQHLCKNQLQIYAQKRGLPLPVYSHERDGPPHAVRFKSTVTIEGKTYTSDGFFPTLKDAENSAAKAALASLLPSGSGEEEMGYKNLLQEFAQKKCFLLPIYVTTRAGEVHAPTFISTVEVNQQVFTGQEARTKKLAEMSAAKTAYTHLKEGNSNQSAAGPVAAGQEQELCLPTPKVDFGLLAHLNQNFQPKLHPVAASKEQKLVSSSPQVELGLLVHPNQNIGPELLVPSEKVGHAGVAEPSTIDPGSFNNKTISKTPSPSPGSPSLSNLQEETADSGTVMAGTNPLVIHPSPDSTEVVKNLPASHPAASPSFTPLVTDAGGVVDSDSSIQHQKDLNPGLPASISHMPSATLADDRSYSGISGLIKSSIGLPNRIVIHPRNISLTYPPGSTVLPVSDSNWVAVSSSSQSTL